MKPNRKKPTPVKEPYPVPANLLTATLHKSGGHTKSNTPLKPSETQCEVGDLSALETFFLLREAGLRNKDKVLVQFYPDFLKALGTEIQEKLDLLESYRKEISKAAPEDCDDWWKNQEKNYPKAARSMLQNLQKENAALYKKLQKGR